MTTLDVPGFLHGSAKMDKLIINGPAKLSGEIHISRAKNAYLPILAGCLLSKERIRLKNIPELRDIKTMLSLLEKLGTQITQEGEWTELYTPTLASFSATYDLVKTMRASIFVLGPLLAREGKAEVSLPGGCAIGTRPIDLHLDNLKKMGAKIDLKGGYVRAEASSLKACTLPLAFPSVGATENLMMASVFTSGTTIIENAAMEPEIEDLGNFLNSMGAKVKGHGSSRIEIEGVEHLSATEYEAIGDRIEAGTYLMAALATGSEITLTGINFKYIDFVIEKLREMGANIETSDNSITVKQSTLSGTKVETAPYPGFPTDLQAQMMALMTTAKDSSIIVENIFENRFMHVPELIRMNALIDLEGRSAFIKPSPGLSAAPVMCTDLRASAALIIAALAAEGETEIQRVYHLDRGYEKLDQKFLKLGASIKRVNSN